MHILILRNELKKEKVSQTTIFNAINSALVYNDIFNV